MALRDGSRTVGAGRLLQRFRLGLVTIQVALAFVTLVAAALLVTTFVRLSKINPGFDAERVMLVSAAFVALSRKLAKVCFALLQNDSRFDPRAHRPALHVDIESIRPAAA